MIFLTKFSFVKIAAIIWLAKRPIIIKIYFLITLFHLRCELIPLMVLGFLFATMELHLVVNDYFKCLQIILINIIPKLMDLVDLILSFIYLKAFFSNLKEQFTVCLFNFNLCSPITVIVNDIVAAVESFKASNLDNYLDLFRKKIIIHFMMKFINQAYNCLDLVLLMNNTYFNSDYLAFKFTLI